MSCFLHGLCCFENHWCHFVWSKGRDGSMSAFTLFIFSLPLWWWLELFLNESVAKSGLMLFNYASYRGWDWEHGSDTNCWHLSVTVFSRVTHDNLLWNYCAAVLLCWDVHLNEILLQKPSSWVCSCNQWQVFSINWTLWDPLNLKQKPKQSFWGKAMCKVCCVLHCVGVWAEGLCLHAGVWELGCKI